MGAKSNNPLEQIVKNHCYNELVIGRAKQSDMDNKVIESGIAVV